jgi:4-hydroxybenzoate polyprenyltransferase
VGVPAVTSWVPAPRAVAELVRAPAALTVPGDSLAGAAAAGWPFGSRTPALAASSVCLYWAGMALNDYADRAVDAVERPERPIPSGRVRPEAALGLAAAMTAAGIGIASTAGGRRALAAAMPLAGLIWAYDLRLKSTPAGPAAMAAARAFDVLLGAGAGRLSRAVPTAAAVGAHTLSVTLLSRREVTGTDRNVPAVALAVTALLAGGLAAGHRAPSRPGFIERVLLSGYAATCGHAQFGALRDPAAPAVRRAVSSGILALIPLQGALAARARAPRTAAAITAAFPLARWMSRKVSPT